jgi:hypothetical protein
MVGDRAELLAVSDDAIRQIRVKLAGESEEALLVDWREVAENGRSG